MNEIILLIVQIIAALGVIVSVVYLGIQIRQQNEITKAEFGHSLSNRMYERYFNTSKDDEFSKFLSKDWSDTEKLSDSESSIILSRIFLSNNASLALMSPNSDLCVKVGEVP